MTGADMVLEALEREGVEVVFGYPGGANLPIYQALPDHPAIRHVLVRHEQGAAHMADGYARATGKPGVVFATSGPGALNLVTGLATAFMDSVPMVAITGQVNTSVVGRDAFQESWSTSARTSSRRAESSNTPRRWTCPATGPRWRPTSPRSGWPPRSWQKRSAR